MFKLKDDYYKNPELLFKDKLMSTTKYAGSKNDMLLWWYANSNSGVMSRAPFSM